MINNQGIPKLSPSAMMKDLKVIRSGFQGLKFLYLMVRPMRRLFVMARIEEGRVLTPLTQTCPHQKKVKQEDRVATGLNTPHMTLRGFWGASFGQGAFFDYIEQCLAEKPDTTTFVLLIAGNDVDGWTDPEQIAFEMDRLKTFCNERGVRLIYIDVVPAWSQQ